MFPNIFPLYGKIVILAGAKFNSLSLQSRLSAAVCDASFLFYKDKKKIPGGSKKKTKIQSYVGHRKDGRATGNQVLSYNQLKTRKLLGARPAGFYLLFQDNLSTANVVLVFFLSRTKVSRIAQGRFWHSTSYHVNMPSGVIRLSQVHTSQWLTPWSVGERGDSWSYKGCSLSIEVQFSSSAKRVLQERQKLLHKTAIEGMHVLTYGHELGNSIGHPKP